MSFENFGIWVAISSIVGCLFLMAGMFVDGLRLQRCKDAAGTLMLIAAFVVGIPGAALVIVIAVGITKSVVSTQQETPPAHSWILRPDPEMAIRCLFAKDRFCDTGNGTWQIGDAHCDAIVIKDSGEPQCITRDEYRTCLGPVIEVGGQFLCTRYGNGGDEG